MISNSLTRLVLLVSVFMAGCSWQLPLLPVSLRAKPTGTPTSVPTATASPNATPTATNTVMPTATATVAPTATPTQMTSLTPGSSPTFTITLTPTFNFPDAEIMMQANCRYGPGQAYLYAHGMYQGDRAAIHGRNYSGNWLWIKPENLDWHCWASASVMEISGDIFAVVVVQRKLPQSTLYDPPTDVEAARQGDQVVVSWEPVWMTEDDDRGYLIEANICQNGQLVPVALRTDGNSSEFIDEGGCSAKSSGLLYTVEKHGYAEPVPIPWP